VILEHSLLDQAAVAEEFDEFARLEPMRVHRITKAAIVAKDPFDDFFLLVLKILNKLFTVHLSIFEVLSRFGQRILALLSTILFTI